MTEFLNHKALGFHLIDGVAANAEAPDTFQIPTEIDRNALKIGDTVKIGYRKEDEKSGLTGERFWAEVTEVTEFGTYVGRVDNDLVLIEDGFDKLIGFSPKHVLEIF